jgi:hypothetical protein
MNGWDRDPQYEPSIDIGGLLILAVFVGLLLFSALGWMFI